MQWFEDFLLYEFFAVALCSYVHMVFTVVREVSTALNINVFTIKPKQDDKGKAKKTK